MDKKASPNAKAGLKVAQTGTPVPAKDFSSSKKEAKAAGPSSKGSMGKAASLPTESASSTPVPTEAKKWENSSEDMMQDYRAAKRKGISSADWEDSASDRISDTAGEKRMREADSKDGNKEIDHPTGYKKGISAFSNSPKVSHGFGHPPAARDGHLRMSGHSGSHRIGKKK